MVNMYEWVSGYGHFWIFVFFLHVYRLRYCMMAQVCHSYSTVQLHQINYLFVIISVTIKTFSFNHNTKISVTIIYILIESTKVPQLNGIHGCPVHSGNVWANRS